MLAYPLGFTLAFIYAFPIIEKKVLESWYKNKAERKQIVVLNMDSSPVPGGEHRNLIMKYFKREEELQGWFQREKELILEKDKLLVEFNELQTRFTELNDNYFKVSSNKDAVNFFAGYWQYSFKTMNTEDDLKDIRFYLDSQQNAYEVNQKGKAMFKIIYFKHDVINDRLHFLKEHQENPLKMFLFSDLRKINNDTYSGLEYGIDSTSNSEPQYAVYNVEYRNLNKT